MVERPSFVMYGKRLFLSLLTAVFCFALYTPAYSEDIKREYEFENGTDPEIVDFITVDGRRYDLSEVSVPRTITQDVLYEHRETIIISIERYQQGRLEDLFPETFAVSGGGFQGTIKKVGSVTAKEAELIVERVDDRSIVLTGLPNNDLIQIPLSHDFDVPSAEGKGVTKTATFRFLGVEWMRDSDGYTATITYRGLSHSIETSHYAVTATYAGMVAQDTGRSLLDTTYELLTTPVVLGSSVVPTTSSAPNDVAGELQNPIVVPLWVFLFAGIAVVLALVWLLLWLLLFRKNAKLVRFERGSEKGNVICRKTLSVVCGEVLFEIPDHVALYDGSLNQIQLKPRLAIQQGELIAHWHDCVVAREEIKACIVIGAESVIKDGVGESSDEQE